MSIHADMTSDSKPEVSVDLTDIRSNDDTVDVEVAKYISDLKQGVAQFRQSNNIPDAVGVLIRRNPEDGSLIFKAVATAAEAVAELDNVAAAIRSELEERESR
jgi:hypothetical protein